MKGTYSAQSLIIAAIASGLLVFSAGAFSLEGQKTAETQKPASAASAHASPIANAINLNKADAQTLAQLNGIGEKKARDIIAYRETSGGFKSVDELLNVKGIGEKTLEKNRALLSVN